MLLSSIDQVREGNSLVVSFVALCKALEGWEERVLFEQLHLKHCLLNISQGLVLSHQFEHAANLINYWLILLNTALFKLCEQ